MAGYLPKNRGNRSTNRVGATVSRRLRAADWNVSPTNRKYKSDGMFVSGYGDTVSILIDFGSDSKNQEVAEGVTDTVCSWDQVPGFVTADPTEDGAIFIRFGYSRTT